MQLLMTISLVLLWVLVIFNLLITFQLIRIVAPDIWDQNSPTLKVGQKSPHFQVESLDGQQISLSNPQIKSILLIFISTSCLTCLERIPEIRALKPFADTLGIQITIICDSNCEKSQSLVKEFDIDLPVVIAPRGSSLWRDFKVIGTPFYCFVNEESKVQAAGLFNNGWDALTKLWKVNAL